MNQGVGVTEKEKLEASFMEHSQSPGDPILEDVSQVKPGLFTESASDPHKNLSSLFNKAAEEPKQTESSGLFGDLNKGNKGDDNPFVNSGNKSMEQRTSLSDLMRKGNNENLFGSTTGGVLQTNSPGQNGVPGTNPNPFFPSQTKPSIFTTSAGGGSLFGQNASAPSSGGLFGGGSQPASGGLFSQIGAGSNSSTGLFNNLK